MGFSPAKNFTKPSNNSGNLQKGVFIPSKVDVPSDNCKSLPHLNGRDYSLLDGKEPEKSSNPTGMTSFEMEKDGLGASPIALTRSFSDKNFEYRMSYEIFKIWPNSLLLNSQKGFQRRQRKQRGERICQIREYI